MATKDLKALSETTSRVERHWINGDKLDLEVFRIPLKELYFNIENGRYADRMIRLRADNPGVDIDVRLEKWSEQIEVMLAGELLHTAKDRAAFEKLKTDLESRDQLRPGVVLADGGVIDGNRRLAALRRLRNTSTNPPRYSFFDAVILPAETTTEDRWRIEAGIQLSVNERWDYSPINELLKVRDGLRLFEDQIARGEHPGETAASLVAKAIYGKDESDIAEMSERLMLIDEYLAFIKKPGEYDLVGAVSERFLEAVKSIAAAQRQERPPQFVAKLKAVLFYQIRREQMDNWQIRFVLSALGGDPTKRGRKPIAQPKVLDEFLDAFPDPRDIRQDLLQLDTPADADISGGSPAPTRVVDAAKVEASTERFIRTMETVGQQKPLRKVAEAARADVQALTAGVGTKKRRDELSVEDLIAIEDAVISMLRDLNTCRLAVKR